MIRRPFFDQYDADGRGAIDRRELGALLEAYADVEWAKLLKATAETGDDLDGVWTALGDAPKGVKLKVEAPAETAEPAAEEPQAAAPKAAAPKAKKKPASKKRKG